MHKSTWMLLALATLAAHTTGFAAETERLGRAAPDAEPWARWQGRLSLGSAAPLWRGGVPVSDTSSPKLNRISLMGDYFLSATPAGNIGGLRATGGVILGPRAQPWIGQPGWGGSSFSIGRRLFEPSSMPYANDAGTDVATLPYLGVGYTGLAARGAWNFSADLGLIAQRPGNVGRLGRALGGSQSLDDAVRDLRLAPLVQVGVSYSF